MKLEQRAVSLDLAMQLKEAKYPQGESLFVWRKGCMCEDYLDFRRGGEIDHNAIDAPTPDELGEELPHEIFYINNHIGVKPNEPHFWFVLPTDKGWHFRISSYRTFITYWPSESYKSEADARASLWLYLKKERLG